MRKFATLVAAAIGAAWPFAVQAGTVTIYTDRTQYDAALAAHSTLTDHPLPATSYVGPTELNFTSSSGVHPVGVIVIPPYGPFLSDHPNDPADTLDMAPASDVRAVAFDYLLGAPPATSPGSLSAAFTVNGSVHYSLTNVSGQPGVDFPFFGVISDSPIASIVFEWTGTGVFPAGQWEAVHDISYATADPATTPAPPALPLFASALAGLGFVGWRRSSAVCA